MPDRDTAIKAGVSGGVSAIMPYVAIGVLGLLGLRELKKLNLDVGGAAGQIIDGVSDTVTNIIDNTKTIIDNTKTIIDNTKTSITNVSNTITTTKEKIVYGGEIADDEQLKTALKESSNVIFVKGKASLGGGLPTSNVIMKSAEVKGIAGKETRYIAPDLKGVVISKGEAARVQSTYGTVNRSGGSKYDAKTPIPYTPAPYAPKPFNKETAKAELLTSLKAAQ